MHVLLKLGALDRDKTPGTSASWPQSRRHIEPHQSSCVSVGCSTVVEWLRNCRASEAEGILIQHTSLLEVYSGRMQLGRMRQQLGRHIKQLFTSSAASADSVITLPNGKILPLGVHDIQLRMPGEFEAHDGCWMAWPRRTDVWRSNLGPAKKAFTDVVLAIGRFEPVTVVAHMEQVLGAAVASILLWRLRCGAGPEMYAASQWQEARAALPDHVRVIEATIDDSWLRDTGPTVGTMVASSGAGAASSPPFPGTADPLHSPRYVMQFVIGEVSACPKPPIRCGLQKCIHLEPPAAPCMHLCLSQAPNAGRWWGLTGSSMAGATSMAPLRTTS